MTNLVVCDVDGTLLPRGQEEIPASMLELIGGLADCGVLFAAASGRGYSELRRLFAPVADRICFICLDGAQVLYRQETLSLAALPRAETIAFVREVWAGYPLEVAVAGEKGLYFKARTQAFRQEMTARGAKEFDCIAHVEDTFLKLAFLGGEPVPEARIPNFLGRVYQTERWQELVLQGANKGRAVEALQERFCIARVQSLAFGDNLNDIEMLRAVTGSFAMADAKPAVKAASRYITDSVEQTLTQLFFSQRPLPGGCGSGRRLARA